MLRRCLTTFPASRTRIHAIRRTVIRLILTLLATLLSAVEIDAAVANEPGLAKLSATATKVGRGQEGSLEIYLHSGPLTVAAVDLEISTENVHLVEKADGTPRCSVAAEINKDASVFSGRCDGQGCTSGRGLIFSLFNIDAIPDGARLVTCKFATRNSGDSGPFSFDIIANAADPTGSSIRVVATRVEGGARPTPAPTSTPKPPATSLYMLIEQFYPGTQHELAGYLDGKLRATRIETDLIVQNPIFFVAGENAQQLCRAPDGVSMETSYELQNKKKGDKLHIVLQSRTGSPLPGGELFSCIISAQSNAAPGHYPSVFRHTRASDRMNRTVPLRVFGGRISVLGRYPTRTPTRTSTRTPIRTPTSEGSQSTPTVSRTPPPTTSRQPPLPPTESPPTPQVFLSIAASPERSTTQPIQIEVSMHSGVIPIAGVETLLQVESGVRVLGCETNPAIGKDLLVNLGPASCHNGLQPCTEARTITLSLDNLDPIPSGSVLYTCNVDLHTNTVPGTYTVFIDQAVASNNQGTTQPVRGSALELSFVSPAPNLIHPRPEPEPIPTVTAEHLDTEYLATATPSPTEMPVRTESYDTRERVIPLRLSTEISGPSAGCAVGTRNQMDNQLALAWVVFSGLILLRYRFRIRG